LSGLTEGGPMSWLTQNVANMLFPSAAEKETNTNTRSYNALVSGYNMVAAPLISYGASVAGNFGPILATPASLIAQKYASPQAAKAFAHMIVGDKGAKPEPYM